MRGLLATLAVALAGAGCLVPDDGRCDRDPDCAGDQVCANTRTCVAAGSTQAVTVRWTVNGAPADATTCGPIPQLAIRVRDGLTGDEHTYAPVLCATGRFHFDKLPTSFDLAAVSVAGREGAQRAPIPAGGGDVWFDLVAAP